MEKKSFLFNELQVFLVYSIVVDQSSLQKLTNKPLST